MGLTRMDSLTQSHSMQEHEMEQEYFELEAQIYVLRASGGENFGFCLLPSQLASSLVSVCADM